MGVTAALLSMLLTAAPGQQTGTGTGASAGTRAPASTTIDLTALPISLERIQRALAHKPLIVMTDPDRNSESGLPTFRIDIEGQKLTIQEILGPDYLRGPTPAGAMTHQEFLNMVTPKDVQGYAAFDNKQAATVALTSLALQWALKEALEAFHDARDARAKEAARKEVQEALEALRKARREAGLPDK
jgi:hypothetical protein